MVRLTSLNRFLFLGFFLLITGCASSGTKKQINSLQAQVGVITDEVVRIDQALQDTRAALYAQEGRAPQAQSQAVSFGVAGPIYRTPSGFEVPALSIQEALKSAGYYQGKVDGEIGSGTKSAIKAFQRDNGLNVDGIVGRQTWERLKVYLRNAIK